MEEFIGLLIALGLFVGIQLLVYRIYKKTKKLALSLVPNLGILLLGGIFGAIMIVSASQNPGSWGDLIGIVLIIYAVIGSGFSTLVSFLMIYILNQRKNQPKKE
jgi:tellurite resistance protein TehA-like permease